MKQIYKRTPMPPIALQLYWSRTSSWAFFCKFNAYFQKTFFQEHLWRAVSSCKSNFHNILCDEDLRTQYNILETHKLKYNDLNHITAQKMNFFIKDFFSKCDQSRSFLRILSYLLKKSLMENFIFCAVIVFASYDILAISGGKCGGDSYLNQPLTQQPWWGTYFFLPDLASLKQMCWKPRQRKMEIGNFL